MAIGNTTAKLWPKDLPSELMMIIKRNMKCRETLLILLAVAFISGAHINVSKEKYVVRII